MSVCLGVQYRQGLARTVATPHTGELTPLSFSYLINLVRYSKSFVSKATHNPRPRTLDMYSGYCRVNCSTELLK